MNAAPRVVLYSIPGQCPLCDEAREVLGHEAIGFAEVDIRSDLALLRAYRDEIPVVAVDGRKVCVGRVDLALLRATLASAPDRAP